jgi:hypothetical protein
MLLFKLAWGRSPSVGGQKMQISVLLIVCLCSVLFLSMYYSYGLLAVVVGTVLVRSY